MPLNRPPGAPRNLWHVTGDTLYHTVIVAAQLDDKQPVSKPTILKHRGHRSPLLGYERAKYKLLSLPAGIPFGGLCVLVSGLLAAVTDSLHRGQPWISTTGLPRP